MTVGATETVMTNLLEYRTCKLQLSLSDSNCTDPIPRVIENLIQPTTSNIILSRSLMETLVPACLALFVGPWSDDNGRKPFLIAAIAGSAITYICCACLALASDLPAFFFTVASTPLAITGGPCTVYMLVVCYINDVTDERTRSFRLSLYSMILLISQLSGSLSTKLVSSVQHFPVNPYSLVFALSACLMIVLCLYIHFCLQESVEVHQIRNRQLFRFSYIRTFFSSIRQSQGSNAMIMILLILCTIMLNVFLLKGESTVIYLSTREMFSWQLADYTKYTIFSSTVYGIGVLSGVWLFSTVLCLPDMLLAAIFLTTRCIRCIIMACSTVGTGFYIAVIVGTFYACYSPLCSMELARLVAKHDLGKVFALSTFIDNVSPTISSPIYTIVYQATYLHYPGAVYWMGAGISATTVILLIIVFILQKCSNGSYYTPSNESLIEEKD